MFQIHSLYGRILESEGANRSNKPAASKKQTPLAWLVVPLSLAAPPHFWASMHPRVNIRLFLCMEKSKFSDEMSRPPIVVDKYAEYKNNLYLGKIMSTSIPARNLEL